ncbi:hypothetical protein JT318_gp21 [Pseudomonas phage PspYZU01]|uniref:DUF1643 domain-containing protein n=1 Tax=Pseudomonas phage PspYZU01 TaxID=1983555 RepID=A0A2U7N4W0_9CAUD|nr:hypothetical protein JT318_gp21 [Pseudomonas phage PspYZU01]ASD51906.1 hypothetical protein PspYZU01_21 [Pseudomonas phage PspYZU01]
MSNPDNLPIHTTLSPCGTYRDFLTRELHSHPALLAWEADNFETGPSSGTMAFIGINPSTADVVKDDQTIKKMCGFAARSGFERIVVGNVFRFRHKSVKVMAEHYLGMGPEGRTEAFLADTAAWQRIADECECVTLCWGNRLKVPEPLRHRIHACERFFRNHGKIRVYHLGFTKEGDPRHPQMLGYNVPFTRLDGPM